MKKKDMMKYHQMFKDFNRIQIYAKIAEDFKLNTYTTRFTLLNEIQYLDKTLNYDVLAVAERLKQEMWVKLREELPKDLFEILEKV